MRLGAGGHERYRLGVGPLLDAGFEVVGTSATTLTESRPQKETDVNDKQPG
jgi:hypothetical protein